MLFPCCAQRDEIRRPFASHIVIGLRIWYNERGTIRQKWFSAPVTISSPYTTQDNSLYNSFEKDRSLGTSF